MKAKTSLLLLTLATTLGLSGPVVAKKLADPEELNCSYGGGMFHCVWNNGMEGVESYKWEVTAEYDVDNADGLVDRKKKFHLSADGSSLYHSVADLQASFNAKDGKGIVTKMPISADVRVKAVFMKKDKDKGKGHAKGGKGKSSPYTGMSKVSFEDVTCPIGMCRPGM